MEAPRTPAPVIPNLEIWVEKVRRECTLQTCAVNMRLAGYHVEFGNPGYERELWRTLSNGEGEWNRWERFQLVDDETMKWRGVHWCYGRWQTYPEKQLRMTRNFAKTPFK